MVRLQETESNSLFNFEGSAGAEILKPYGGVAQLGEHLPCTQGVRSSNLLISTMQCQVIDMCKSMGL